MASVHTRSIKATSIFESLFSQFSGLSLLYGRFTEERDSDDIDANTRTAFRPCPEAGPNGMERISIGQIASGSSALSGKA